MTVKEFAEKEIFTLVNLGENETQEITKPFCCDLLSICMGRLPKGAAWVTVMGNINTLAVLSLTDASCIILAEGADFDAPVLEKAKKEKLTVFRTTLPVFEAALAVNKALYDSVNL